MPSRRPSRGASLRRPLLLGGLLLLVAAAWTVWQGLQGARDLRAAADQLAGVQDQLIGGDGSTAGLERIGALTASSTEHLQDPLVRAVSALPVLGDPVDAAQAVAASADLAVRQALLPLVAAAGADPGGRLVAGPGAFDLDYLADLAEPTARAAAALERSRTVLDGAPASRISAVDDEITGYATDLSRLRSVVSAAAVGAALGPDLLGQGGVKRYLAVSQSPAEARGTGGLIGGFNVLEVRDGAVRVLQTGKKSDLLDPPGPVVDHGPEFDEHYGFNRATTTWINSNISPHFPYAARTWMAMWKAQSGVELDGAVLLDPVALSYLLEATGPLPLPDGSQVDAAGVVDLTLRDVYARFAEDEPRDAFLASIQGAVVTALTQRETAARPLLSAIAQGVGERRLLLWSADERLQERLETEQVAGALPRGPAVGDVVVDSAGSKLDYYLERELAYVPGCGGRSALRLRLTNAAPASGLPEYVTPAQFRTGLPPGTNKLLSTLYVPPGSTDVRLTADGEQVEFRTGTELGLGWAETFVILEPGQSTDIEVTFQEPGADGVVERIAQPLVRPERYTAGAC